MQHHKLFEIKESKYRLVDKYRLGRKVKSFPYYSPFSPNPSSVAHDYNVRMSTCIEDVSVFHMKISLKEIQLRLHLNM